ncbi:MAG: hypothetical protein O3B86_11065 [Planctomycetota bacterium]|nr:hypothetical protein [Planctomycetota bacterium]
MFPAPISSSNPQTFPQPGFGPDRSLPQVTPQPDLGLPTPSVPTPRPAVELPGSATSSNGITLPPRRATSVTIDIPAGSSGGSLTLPDPVRSGLPGGIVPETGSGLPAATPASPPNPLPSLRVQPPRPVPSNIPGNSASYQQPAYSLPLNQLPTMPGQTFQPTTHWQAVPQWPQQAAQQLQLQQPGPLSPQSSQWRVMTDFYAQPENRPVQQGYQPQPVYQPQPALQPQPTARSQRPLVTPSDRVIFLPSPPRR